MTEQGSGAPPPPPELIPPVHQTPAPSTAAPPDDPYFVAAPETPAPAAPRSRRMSMGTVIVVALGVLAAVGAYFAVTKATDKPAPTPEQVSAAFVPLEGFEYSEMPTESLEPLRQAFASQGAGEAVAHFDARQVSSGGSPQAVVFILSVDPDEMKGSFEESYVKGFTATSQASVEDLDIGDTSGHIAETPLGTIAFFFDADGFAFNIVGRDTATVESIARALEEGNS